MSRLSVSAVLLAAALGASGCAHCDTCDDFPAPATGSGWGDAPYYDGPALSSPTPTPAPAASLGPVNDGAPPASAGAGSGGAKPADAKSATESKPTLEPAAPARPDPFRPGSGS